MRALQEEFNRNAGLVGKNIKQEYGSDYAHLKVLASLSYKTHDKVCTGK